MPLPKIKPSIDDFGDIWDGQEPRAVDIDLTWSPVYAAVYGGDLARLQTLLAAGHDVGSDGPSDTPLMLAVIQNKREAARMLLEAGADPLFLHEDGVGEYTPLTVAAARGHDEMARLLWTALPSEKLAKYEDSRAHYGNLGLLNNAATYGRTSLIEFLLDGWLPGGEVWDAAALEKALLSATRSWQVHAAMLLLDRVKTYTPDTLRAALFTSVGDKMVPPDIMGPVYEGVDCTDNELLVRRLLEDRAFDPNVCQRGRPLIHYAIEPAYRVGALRALLAKGADPNSRDEEGRTPLQRLSAPTVKNISCGRSINETGIHLLLEHGASVAAADTEGETPLHAAAFGANLHIFRRLLRSTTRDALSAANNHGETPLHYAAAGANIGVLRFLLESADPDLDVSAATANGWTPLLCALAPTGFEASSTRRNPEDTVQGARLLLERGADAAAVTAEGWSALHCLARHRNKHGDTRFEALAEALMEKGAPLRAEARSLGPEWEYKARRGRHRCDRFPWGFRMGRLVEAAPEGVFEAEATTPLEWARRSKGKAVEEVLLARAGRGEASAT